MDAPSAPTEPVPFDRQTPLVPPWHDEIPSRLDRFSRDDCALLIDFYLRRLVSLKNRVDPGLAAGLARMRDGEKHRLLGFVRMKDYAEECLDLDWRRARYLMTIHDAFQGLPLLAGAFEKGHLSWTRAREITSVADAETQGQWLDFASTTTVRLLAGAVRRFRATGQAPWEGGENTGTGGAGDNREAREQVLDGENGKAEGGSNKGVTGDEEASAGDEQWTTFSSLVPFALRRQWEMAVEACRRHAGGETPLWECAEYMAAEILNTVSGLEGVEESGGTGLSGVPGTLSDIEGEDRLTGDGRAESASGHPADDDRSAGDGQHRRLAGNHPAISGNVAGREKRPGPPGDEDRDLIKADIENEYDNWSFLSWAPVMVKLVGQLEADLGLVKSAVAEAKGKEGARCLHEAFLRLVGYHELIERYLGRLLRFFGDHRLYERCRFLSLRHYARERLGVSSRQVGYLTSRERVFIQHPELEQAFLDGRLGSAKVRLLEPFARQLWPCHWKAWVERAERVTVRRLADETGWAVDFCQRDPAAWLERKGAPPALGEGPYAGVDGRWHTCYSPDGTGASSGNGLVRTVDEWHTCSCPDQSPEGQVAQNSDGTSPAPGVPGPGGDPDSPEVTAGVTVSEGQSHVCPAPGVLPVAMMGFGAGRSDPPLTSLIRFTAPSGAAAVWSRAVEACRRLVGDNAPTWRCLEMIVDHFLLVWAPKRDPEHLTTGYPNAVFQRDGWRCTVPGCRTRSNLTPHHIVKRSRGGGDEMANLTTVCWKHHLQGIHQGLVWVNGRAPDQLVWELGRMVGETPILATRGDWVLGTNGGCDQGVKPGSHSLVSRTIGFS